MKKKLIIGIGAFLAFLFLILIGLTIAMNTVLSPGFIVGQIESSLNVRAEVQEIHTGIFSPVSSFQIKGVKLAPRDSFANDGVSLDQRPPLKGSTISAESIDLHVNFLSLLNKNLEVSRFTMDRANLNLVLYPDGSNNLTSLFRAPKIVHGKKNPALEQPKTPDEQTESSSEKAGNEEKEFHIQDLPISANLKRIGFENSSVRIDHKKNRQIYEIAPLNLVIQSIDLDPKDLKNHNSAHAYLDGKLGVFTSAKQEIASFGIHSNGKIEPLFDPESGKFNQIYNLDIQLKDGSFLSNFAALEILGGQLPILKQAGLQLNALKEEKAILLKDVMAHMAISSSQVKFLKTLNFPTKNYALALDPGTVLQYSNNTHVMEGAVIASEEESKRAIAKVDAYIKKQMKGDIQKLDIKPEDIRNKLLSSIIKEDRIHLNFLSTGNLSDPVVRLKTEIPSLVQIMKEMLGDQFHRVVSSELKKMESQFDQKVDQAISDQLPGGVGNDRAKKAVDSLKGFLK